MKIHNICLQMDEDEFVHMVEQWLNATYEPCSPSQFEFTKLDEVEFDQDEKSIYIHISRK